MTEEPNEKVSVDDVMALLKANPIRYSGQTYPSVADGFMAVMDDALGKMPIEEACNMVLSNMNERRASRFRTPNHIQACELLVSRGLLIGYANVEHTYALTPKGVEYKLFLSL